VVALAAKVPINTLPAEVKIAPEIRFGRRSGNATLPALLGIRLRKREMRQFLCVSRVMGCGWVLHLEIK